jgi:hypothetical protein
MTATQISAPALPAQIILSTDLRPSVEHEKAKVTTTAAQITTIDTKPIIEHGESPASVILSIAILLSVLFGGLTWLVYVILGGKPPR